LTNYSAEDLQNAGRIKQIRWSRKLVNEQNKRALPITFGAAAGIIVIFVLIGLLTGLAAFLIPVGVLLGLLTAMILFGRFAQAAQYSAIDGQLGGARGAAEHARRLDGHPGRRRQQDDGRGAPRGRQARGGARRRGRAHAVAGLLSAER